MLIRSTWILKLSESISLPRAYGLELVKDLHKKMNLEMGNNNVTSVSYSGLQGAYYVSKETINFNSDEFYQLTICGLTEQAAKAIQDLDLTSGIELFGAKFNTCDRLIETSSYEQLYHDLIASEPEPVKTFKLKFTTPTAFAQSGNYMPLPVPLLCFRSWLSRWNHFAPVYLGSEELLMYLADAIALRYHNICTRGFPLSHNYINGFTGDVTLQILRRREEPLLANVANLLVNYSQFSATGMKTRLGMGQTQLITNN